MSSVNALGCKIIYASDDPEIYEWLVTHGSDEATGRAAQPWTIHVGHINPSRPVATSARSGHRGIRFAAEGDEAFWAIGPEGGAGHLAIDQTGAHIGLTGDSFRAWDVLHALVSEAISASGLLRVHCAATASGERAYIYLGPSGRGKTTTMLRAVAAGHRPIAEDLCWLDPASMMLFPTDRNVKILPHAKETVGGPQVSAAWTPTGRGKLSTPMETFGGVARGRTLTDVVLLERAPDLDTAWLPVTGPETVLALYAAVGIPNTARQRDFVATSLGRVTELSRCRVLRLGRTPIQF